MFSQKILSYAKENMESFEKGCTSSNEIRFFEYENKKYVLKVPQMRGDNISPFWKMMNQIFGFTFEMQSAHISDIYDRLKDNPHIKVAPFVASDEDVMIFEFVEGDAWNKDEFPKGNDNAYRLGQYIGYNHQVSHQNCGIIGKEDVTDFCAIAFAHIENCIKLHWDSESEIDKRVRNFWQKMKSRQFASNRYTLMMVDICADQFLFKDEDVVACVDLDAYVIGPIEWELSFLHKQIEDWKSFKAGYETYQPLPEFEEMSNLFFFIMGLNSYNDKREMEEYWSNLLEETL